MHNSSGLQIACTLAGACVSLAAAAQTNHYVSPAGGNSSPYTNWTTAATTIQAAIEASGTNDVIWVTNGIYQAGGVTNYPAGSALTNRVAIYKRVFVRSVNGPSNTVIRGAWHPVTTNGPAAVRCVYMAAGAELHGFTVTNGATFNSGSGNEYSERSGGGIRGDGSGLVSNCVIAGNAANYCGAGGYNAVFYNCRFFGNSAGSGGGGGTAAGRAYDCSYSKNYGRAGGSASGTTLYNCSLTGSIADWAGGGAYQCNMYNCLLEGNYAGSVGGGAGAGGSTFTAYNCTIIGNAPGWYGGGVWANAANAYTLYNCVVISNAAGNYDANTVVRYCNSSPLAPGDGNINVDPMFVAPGSGYGASHVFGDCRLKLGSPCVNVGTNFSWQASDPLGYGRDRDLDGRPRLRGPFVDMGAYEQYITPGTIFFIRGGQ